MENKPKFDIKPVLITTLTAAICATLLAGAYTLLKDDIEANEKQAVLDAVSDVIVQYVEPSANLEGMMTYVVKEKVEADGKVKTIRRTNAYIAANKIEKRVLTNAGKEHTYYIGYDAAGKIFGYAFAANSQGYSEENKFIIGYNATITKIVRIGVVSHAETPGLGAEMEKEYFKERFVGKSAWAPLTVVKLPSKDEGAIDSLSGATITSVSVTSAINSLSANLMEWKAKSLIHGCDNKEGAEGLKADTTSKATDTTSSASTKGE